MRQIPKFRNIHNSDLKQWEIEGVPNTSVSDLDQELLTRYLQEYRARQRCLTSLEDDAILRQTAVITDQGTLTLAGLYAMGIGPQERYPALTITAEVHEESRATTQKIRDKQSFTGPIPVLLDGAIDWAYRNLSMLQYDSDGRMRQRSELPLAAVRELLANALVHRDLSPLTLENGSTIQIQLKPNCLLIQSPGGLRGISLTQLTSTKHTHIAVNQRVYRICKLLQSHDGTSIIDGDGGGITEVFRAAKSYGLPEPTLTDTGVSFSVFLWRRLSGSNTSLVHSALANGPLSIEQITQHTGLATHQVRYVLKKLISQNQAEMLGQRGSKSTTYRLTREHPHFS